MVYTRILLAFGILPIATLWLLRRRLIRRYAAVLLWLPPMIVAVGASWEIAAIDRVWFYAPGATLGPRVLTIPVEEWGYYVLDALLVATVAIIARAGRLRKDGSHAPD